jgi:flagellar hook-associated protein 1 FlgK
MSGLFGVGVTAMMAAYTQMRTASHNIANVNTPGYSRQEVELATAGASQTGAGFLGRGVSVETIARRYDQHLAAEVAGGKATAAADTARASEVSRLEALFSDTENGLGRTVDDLQMALADLANRPGDPATRTAVLSRARGLVERFTSAGVAMDSLRQQADQRLRDGASKVNDALAQIASLNDQIARRSSLGQPPNDLFDRRDQLVETINGQLRATSFLNSDGTVNLYTPTGHALVTGAQASRLTVAADPVDSRKVALLLGSGASAIPVDATALGGGALAGVLRFRDSDLEAAQARVGQLAAAIAETFNDRQALGRDATGAVGAAMFATGAPVVSASAYNTGSAALAASVVDGTAMLATDYELRYTGTQWQATSVVDGATHNLGATLPATLDGLQISLGSGTANAGDRFLLRGASSVLSGFKMSLAGTQGLATGLAATPQRGAANTGDARIAAFAVTANGPNLQQPVSITFTSATTFDVTGTGTGNPTGLTYTPGMTLSYNGWSMTLGGAAATGDTFSVSATTNPALDNRNARLMLESLGQGIVAGRKPVDACVDLVAEVGIRVQSAQAASDASTQALAQSESARAEVSGVNLDEEAARLLQYQQAYQAAAKILTTARDVFDTLLQIQR